MTDEKRLFCRGCFHFETVPHLMGGIALHWCNNDKSPYYGQYLFVGRAACPEHLPYLEGYKRQMAAESPDDGELINHQEC